MKPVVKMFLGILSQRSARTVGKEGARRNTYTSVL